MVSLPQIAKGERFTYCDGIHLAEELDLIAKQSECYGKGDKFTKLLEAKKE